MNIDKVIHSSDNNPLYLDFWEHTSKIWSKKFGVIPILLFIGSEEDYRGINKDYGEVIRIDPNPDYPIGLQTLSIRYFWPYTEQDTTWMISDIDMFPLSKSYFLHQIENIDDNKYVHLNPCIQSYTLYPSCYNVAKGHTFSSVLNLPDTFDKFLLLMKRFNRNNLECFWGVDERYLTFCLMNYSNKDRIVLLERDGGQNGHRIDREVSPLITEYDPELVRSGWYYDCHSVRPYSSHKETIDLLVSRILKSEKE